MSALNPLARLRFRQADASGAASDGFVLPRLLRKPVRLVARLDAEAIGLPRYAMAMLCGALFAATGLYGAAVGGHFPSILRAVTAHSGFAIEDVRIAGNRETSEIDVVGELDLDGWTSLVGLDPEAARERIASLPWVETVSVRKVYPTALDVAIVEKKPFAIWQRGDDLTLIERSGKVIAPFRSERYATLPLVVGMGAPDHAPAIVARVARHPGLASRVKAYIRVSDRRWDLRFENGVTVKLPENGIDAALAGLVEMDGEQGVLSRDIAAVDLRLDDRIVVRLTPEAVVRRDAALKNLGKRAGRERRT